MVLIGLIKRNTLGMEHSLNLPEGTAVAVEVNPLPVEDEGAWGSPPVIVAAPATLSGV